MASPSTLGSASGVCAAHAWSLPELSCWLFQTVSVAAEPSLPPMTTIPSDTATADDPVRAAGRASASSVAQSPRVPSLATVS